MSPIDDVADDEDDDEDDEDDDVLVLSASAPGTPTTPSVIAADNDMSAVRPSRVILRFTRRGIVRALPDLYEISPENAEITS